MKQSEKSESEGGQKIEWRKNSGGDFRRMEVVHGGGRMCQKGREHGGEERMSTCIRKFTDLLIVLK